MIKVFNTPRPYISWSQLSLVLSDPERYRQVYVLGNDNFKLGSAEMTKGSKIHKCLETGEESKDDDIEFVKEMMPETYKKLKIKEYPITVMCDRIPVFGKFDAFNKKTLELAEVKTGTTKWTQRMVDTNKQITMYSLMIYCKFKKLPSKITLYHIKTIKEDNKIVATGEIESFQTKRTMVDILSFQQKMQVAWNKIIELTTKEYKSAKLIF